MKNRHALILLIISPVHSLLHSSIIYSLFHHFVCSIAWSAYIKFEMRQGELVKARGLYERWENTESSQYSSFYFIRLHESVLPLELLMQCRWSFFCVLRMLETFCVPHCQQILWTHKYSCVKLYAKNHSWVEHLTYFHALHLSCTTSLMHYISHALHLSCTTSLMHYISHALHLSCIQIPYMR